MKALKNISSILLRIGISIALLVFLFRQVDRKSLFGIIKNADKLLLAASFFIYFLTYVLCLLRWEMLLKAVKIHLPLKRVVISYAGGVFFSLFLPSTIGGDVMRSIDLAAHTKKTKEVLATVFLDRLSGYVGLAVLALISVIIGWNHVSSTHSVLLAVFVIVSVLVVVLLVLFNRFFYAKINSLLHSPNAGKIRDLLKNVHQEIHYFRNKERTIAGNLIFSFLIQIVAPLSFYVIALSLGVKINVIYFLIFLPIIGAITMLPISIGGLGLRDATTIFFFTKVGMSKDLAFAMSLLNFSFILFIGAVGGIIYVLTVRHRRIQHHQARPV
ncbi:MAG: flippase-like domain-containing protein [Candidatus Omnitrophica bacterium]|nr:flippase-like domain-containing protein [Candidatus Omnitrophota bacterium]